MRGWTIAAAALVMGLTALPGGEGGAQGRAPDLAPVSYNLYGLPGLIDLPTARSAPDAELASTISAMPGTVRGTLAFQLAPRLTGAFRYSRLTDGDAAFDDRFDRSFDLHFRLLDEGPLRPALAVGLRDFVGTGIYSGEYIVATKSIGSRLEGTLGIGWGRYAGEDGFTNPLGLLDDAFETRPGRDGEGGEFEFDRIFRGDAALFGGLAWKASDRLTLKAEYSPDLYALEESRDHFERRSPINIGVDWTLRPGLRAQLAWLHGGTAAAGLTFALNPRRPAVNGGRDPAPQAVLVRPAGAAADLAWTRQQGAEPILRDNVARALENDAIVLEALRLAPRRATVLIRNPAYRATPQAIGRTARVLTRVLPASIETFEIAPVSNGIPTAAIVLQRSDLEALENAPDATWRAYVRARIESGEDAYAGAVTDDGLYPRLAFSLAPFVRADAFDPEAPLRVDLGLGFGARVDLAPGLSLQGNVSQRIAGNRDDADQPSDSPLPRVRSESFLYAREDLAVNTLFASYQTRPAENLYGRISAGWLERQYGGVSTELLWKRPDSRLALGVEVNYARQRDFEGLDFRDYDIVTGHASAYWQMANGFDAQLDVGRYLAGDVGATVTLERTFANGWRVGAFASRTDVSARDFGEGSFDKGLTLTVPLDYFAGRSTGRERGAVIRPVLRDGGARLAAPDRLYPQVRDDTDPALRRSWGRFWR